MLYRLISVTLSLSLLVIASAHAAFIERDLFAQGDGLLTYDTTTGLEWLDVNSLVSLTYTEINESEYVTEHRFRLATESDFNGLKDYLGFTTGSENINEAYNLLKLIGNGRHFLGIDGSPTFITGGKLEWNGTAGSDETQGWITTDMTLEYRPASASMDIQNYLGVAVGTYEEGAYLVRQAAPLPSPIDVDGDNIEGLAEAIHALQVVSGAVPPVCSNDHLNLCNAVTCAPYANGHWYNNVCNLIPEPICGNGERESGEECDDGNYIGHDGCTSLCKVNQAPIALAGDVITGFSGDTIDLIGSANDAEDDSLSYLWSIVSSPLGSTPSVYSDMFGQHLGAYWAGEYQLSLTVYDEHGTASQQQLYIVSVVDPVCGNNTVESDEVCDGTAFNGDTCESRGFDGGTLSCLSDCTVDTSGCYNDPVCGNGVPETGEECDDGNLAGGDGCSSVCSLEFGYDTDGDGIPDEDEQPATLDTDEDTIPNYLDPDDDGDGVPTLDELPIANDFDNDGISDYLDPTNDMYLGFPTPKELDEYGIVISCERTVTTQDLSGLQGTENIYTKTCSDRTSGKVISSYSESHNWVNISYMNPIKTESVTVAYKKPYLITYSDSYSCHPGDPGKITISGTNLDDFLFPSYNSNSLSCDTYVDYTCGAQYDHQFLFNLYDLTNGGPAITTFASSSCLANSEGYSIDRSSGNCVYTYQVPIAHGLGMCRDTLKNQLPASIAELAIDGSCHIWWDYSDEFDVLHECMY